MKPLALRKETLAELSPDDLALVVAGTHEPTPPYYSVRLTCVVDRVTTLRHEQTPPISGDCKQ